MQIPHNAYSLVLPNMAPDSSSHGNQNGSHGNNINNNGNQPLSLDQYNLYDRDEKSVVSVPNAFAVGPFYDAPPTISQQTGNIWLILGFGIFCHVWLWYQALLQIHRVLIRVVRRWCNKIKVSEVKPIYIRSKSIIFVRDWRLTPSFVQVYQSVMRTCPTLERDLPHLHRLENLAILKDLAPCYSSILLFNS